MDGVQRRGLQFQAVRSDFVESWEAVVHQEERLAVALALGWLFSVVWYVLSTSWDEWQKAPRMGAKVLALTLMMTFEGVYMLPEAVEMLPHR